MVTIKLFRPFSDRDSALEEDAVGNGQGHEICLRHCLQAHQHQVRTIVTPDQVYQVQWALKY